MLNMARGHGVGGSITLLRGCIQVQCTVYSHKRRVGHAVHTRFRRVHLNNRTACQDEQPPRENILCAVKITNLPFSVHVMVYNALHLLIYAYTRHVLGYSRKWFPTAQ